MPVLSQFKQVLPAHESSQSQLTEWLADCHQEADRLKNGPEESAPIRKLFQRYSVKETQISRRRFECEDILSSDWKKNRIYRLDERSPEGADIRERNLYFSEKANRVFHDIYPTASRKPDHLIHVTCTGYVSPSAAQRMAALPEWGGKTEITHAYHMGCYASLPAVRLGNALVQAKAASNYQVDIVHTEMCGLHLNPLHHTPEQIIVQSLFADGHIKYSVLADSVAPSGLKVLTTQEHVVPDSQDDMSWIPAPWGMQMTLSREVPGKIRGTLRNFLTQMAEQVGADVGDLIKNAIFAIHPGGPKIIDSVQEVLELRDDQTALSKKVLLERGNMSSATLPHVWHSILNSQPLPGTRVVSFAFGPGLTIFGAIFEVVGK